MLIRRACRVARPPWRSGNPALPGAASVRGVLLVLLAAIATAVTLGAPAQAQTSARTIGIRLLDAPSNRSNDARAREYIVDHVAPGTTITRHLEVSNNTTTAGQVQLYAAAANVSGGTFQFGEARASNDLSTWTTIDPATVSPPSASKSQATVTIAVPATANPGERYAVVWAELPAAVPPGGGIAAVNRVGIRIYLSVGAGQEPASDFVITSVEARRDAQGNPAVAATVHNTGGRALDLSGELTLANGPGGLSAGPFAANLGTTLGIGQTDPVLVILDRAIPAGPWDARITLRSGAVEHVATARITFPSADATASRPVATHTNGSGGSGLLPELVGIAALILATLIVVLVHRR
jgi:hypothetical protein